MKDSQLEVFFTAVKESRTEMFLHLFDINKGEICYSKKCHKNKWFELNNLGKKILDKLKTQGSVKAHLKLILIQDIRRYQIIEYYTH